MKKVAITGAIGSGKSYVGNLLRSANYKVLDLDDVAKQVRDNEAKKAIQELFKTTNPERISAQIYSDSNKLKALNNIMHPLILKRMLNFFDKYQKERIVFVEVPLLYELGWEKYFDHTICVAANLKTTIERLVNYRHMPIDQAIKISEAQLSNDVKKAKSEFVIENNIDTYENDLINRINEVVMRCLH